MVSLFLLCLFLLSQSRLEAGDSDPLVLFVSIPHFSHISVLLPVANELSSRGYSVVFPTDLKYEKYFGPKNTSVFRDLFFRYGDLAKDKRYRLDKIYKEGLGRISEGKIGMSASERMRSLCQIACGGSWSIEEYTYVPRDSVDGQEVSLWDARNYLGEELILAYNDFIDDLMSEDETRQIFLVVDSVVPFWTGEKVGEKWGLDRMLFDTTLARLRKNPFIYPSYFGDSTINDFSFFKAIYQAIQMTGNIIQCPNLIKRASKMSWAKDVVTVYPTPIGFDRYTGASDPSPMRRYVGFISLPVEARDSDEDEGSIVNDWLEKQKIVVYVSAGSQFSFPEIVLTRTLEALGKFTDVSVLLLAKHNEEVPQRLANAFGDKLLVWRKWITQYEVLKHPKTKMMITHAGSAGIVEAIRTLTPVVAFPMTFDQFNCASRLLEAGLGNRIVSYQDLEPEVIFEKFKDILFDRPEFYVSNLQKLNDLSRCAGEESRAADIVVEIMLHGTDHLKPYIPPFLARVKQLASLAVVLLVWILSPMRIWMLLAASWQKVTCGTCGMCKRKREAAEKEKED